MNLLLLALSYLLGATPTSYWVGRGIYGVDLRTRGSGNLGATNTFRVLGWKAAVPVVAVDMAKGFVPAQVFAGVAGASLPWAMAFGVAAVVGHMFSVWVGLRGGKGVATSGGVLLAFAPWAVLGGLAVWVAVTFGTRYVALGSMSAAVALPLLVALTPHSGGSDLVWFTAAVAALVVVAHRSNIRRLAHGTENRFGRGSADPGARDGGPTPPTPEGEP